MDPNEYDVIVVGGGASGLIAAGRAAELGAKVLLLEKNTRLGEKLKITGGGRCNITNAEYDTRALVAHYGEAGEFLFSVFSKFGVKETFSFFESHGLPLVIEDRKRVFPKSQKALDVFDVLQKYIHAGNVMIRTKSPVTRVLIENKVITSVMCGNNEYHAKSFIFATGGVSHPKTGSTGDGFKWLRDIGHTVVDPTPTVVPLAVADEWARKLAGISLPLMKINLFVDGVKGFSKKGRLLFTHFGISGPLILNSAHVVGDMLQSGIVTAEIDLFPDLDLGKLERKAIDLFDLNKNKLLKNVLSGLVPAGMAKGISILIGERINLDTKVHSVSREDRKILVHLLKKLPLTITHLMGHDRAVISDGGVTLTEIDTKTMRSKVVKNLFITGDLLHINRPSGGYSLQLCWTTGYMAGGEAASS